MSLGNISQSFRMPAQFASMLPYLFTIFGVWIRGYQLTKKALREKKGLNSKHTLKYGK